MYGVTRAGKWSILLRQCLQNVLHQHGADHHFLTVDRQLGGSFLFGGHGDQHQATAGHCPASEPVNRMIRRRDRRTEVKVAQVESKDKVTEIKEGYTCHSAGFLVQVKQKLNMENNYTPPHNSHLKHLTAG